MIGDFAIILSVKTAILQTLFLKAQDVMIGHVAAISPLCGRGLKSWERFTISKLRRAQAFEISGDCAKHMEAGVGES